MRGRRVTQYGCCSSKSYRAPDELGRKKGESKKRNPGLNLVCMNFKALLHQANSHISISNSDGMDPCNSIKVLRNGVEVKTPIRQLSPLAYK